MFKLQLTRILHCIKSVYLVPLMRIKTVFIMHFLSEDLEIYIENHSQNEPELLAQLNKETYQKVLLPRMLSGHFQGRVLSMLSKLIRPTNILEIGTYTGYSALCLCEGMQENGVLHTIDIKEELVENTTKHWPTPYNRIFFVYKESKTHKLNSKSFNRNNFFIGIGTRLLISFSKNHRKKCR